MKYIIKLFPEILLKSKTVRNRMVQQLQRNLHRLLRQVDAKASVNRFWDKIEVLVDNEYLDSIEILLANTPGIDQFLSVAEYPLTDITSIAKQVASVYGDEIKGKSFAVRCKRTGKHDFTSMDVDRFVGAFLMQHGQPKGVNLKHPDVRVDIEIHQQQVNIVYQRKPGLGGYPLGIQGACLSLMSGGFDSTVASYETIKRGLVVHYVFFNLGGNAHEIGVKQVAFYLWKKYASTHPVQFITVPFEGVVTEILSKVSDGYMGVVLKRLMLRAAEKVAEQMQLDALVTGESIAQVSSQTLRNLALIDQATDKLVLRPLVTTNKQDIMNTAAQIGTADFAKNMPEYCGVISRRPVIHADQDTLIAEEGGFDSSVLNAAVAAAVAIRIDSVIADISTISAIETVHQIDDHIIIDIRRPDEQMKRPLEIDPANLLQIPFTEINHRFNALDQDREYLLYCEQGVMSQLHAQYLQDAGYTNVRVYRITE